MGLGLLPLPAWDYIPAAACRSSGPPLCARGAARPPAKRSPLPPARPPYLMDLMVAFSSNGSSSAGMVASTVAAALSCVKAAICAADCEAGRQGGRRGGHGVSAVAARPDKAAKRSINTGLHGPRCSRTLNLTSSR